VSPAATLTHDWIYETPDLEGADLERFRWRMAALYRRWLAEVGLPDQVAMVRGIRSIIEEGRRGWSLSGRWEPQDRTERLAQVAPRAWRAAVDAYRVERADVIARAWAVADTTGASNRTETVLALQDLEERYPVEGPDWWAAIEKRFRVLVVTPIDGTHCKCGAWIGRTGTDEALVLGERVKCEACGESVILVPLVWAPANADTSKWTWEVRLVWACAQQVAGDKPDRASRIVRKLARYMRCGGLWDWSAVLSCSRCGTEQVQRYRCDDRWCPGCARARSTEYAKRIRTVIEKGGSRKAKRLEGAIIRLSTEEDGEGRLRTVLEAREGIAPIDTETLWFLTLTMGRKRLRGKTVDDAIEDCLDAWKKLQRRNVFGAVRGGIRKVEVKAKAGWWHVHIHAVLVADWTVGEETTRARKTTGEVFRATRPVEAASIFDAWEDCGGGSPVGQDCVRLYGRDALAGLYEAFKYQTKFDARQGVLSDSALEELVASLGSMAPTGEKKSGRRILQGFGCLYNVTVAETCARCGGPDDHGPGQICECGAIHRRPLGPDDVVSVLRDGTPAPPMAKRKRGMETEPVAVASWRPCRCGRSVPVFPVQACIGCGWLRTHRTACKRCGSHALNFNGLAAWHGSSLGGTARGRPGLRP
jgi:hypothetical protein